MPHRMDVRHRDTGLVEERIKLPHEIPGFDIIAIFRAEYQPFVGEIGTCFIDFCLLLFLMSF